MFPKFIYNLFAELFYKGFLLNYQNKEPWQKFLSQTIITLIWVAVECLIFARTLLREFHEAPQIRQNKARQI